MVLYTRLLQFIECNKIDEEVGVFWQLTHSYLSYQTLWHILGQILVEYAESSESFAEITGPNVAGKFQLFSVSRTHHICYCYLNWNKELPCPDINSSLDMCTAISYKGNVSL